MIEITDHRRFGQWLARDPARLRVAFRVFNPKRPQRGNARSVLSWITTVERVIELEPH